jgi:Flp pilus assembly protein TadG
MKKSKRNAPQTLTGSHRTPQKGAVTLEFVFLFMIFFAVFYGIVSYSLMLMVRQGLVHAASEGAHASVQLDPGSFSSTANYQTAVDSVVKDAVLKDISWMPLTAQNQVKAPGGISTSWANQDKTVVTGGTPLKITTRTLTVSVSYANYAANPLVPGLGLSGIMPALPSSLTGSASVQPPQ